MARYGSQAFVEHMPTKPQDPYGIAKVASEEVLINLSEVHNVDWTILCASYIVGPRQNMMRLLNIH